MEKKPTAAVRIVVYAGTLLVFALLVVLRQQAVTTERAKLIASSFEQWQKFGRPVVAVEMQRGDVRDYLKISIRPGPQNRASGFLTQDMRRKVQAGQPVYAAPDGEVIGQVIFVGGDIDTAAGMFAVEIALSMQSPREQTVLVAYAQVETIKNVLVVPAAALDIDGEAFCVWKVEGRQAVRHKVTVVSRGSYGAVIGSGIVPGNMVIIQGQRLLRAGERVRIVE